MCGWLEDERDDEMPLCAGSKTILDLFVIDFLVEQPIIYQAGHPSTNLLASR